MDFFCETEAAAISARLSLTQALLGPDPAAAPGASNFS